MAGFEGLVATWVAGCLLAGLLGLFPGLGGLSRAGRAWWRAQGALAMTVFTVQPYSTVGLYSTSLWLNIGLSPGQARNSVLLA